MDPNRIDRLSVTPTVNRQTPRNEFGQVLKDTLQTAASVGGALVGAMPGGAIISAAVSSVTNFASRGSQAAAERSVSAAATVGGTVGATRAASGGMDVGAGGVPSDFNSMLTTMRAEADKSIVMQMQMQQESREYNTLTNVLKVRHDSAKAAINNIR